MAEEKIIQADFQNDVWQIVVDDGSVRVPIRNKQGDELGVFYFRPTDLGIIDRFNSMAGEIDKIIAPLENIDINPDGTADSNDETVLSAMREAEQHLYAACDKMFGGNMSEAFFGKMHPFSPIGGHFYCENALNAVGQYVSKQFDAEIKKVNARVSKYTHGVKTGKHKNGTTRGMK